MTAYFDQLEQLYKQSTLKEEVYLLIAPIYFQSSMGAVTECQVARMQWNADRKDRPISGQTDRILSMFNEQRYIFTQSCIGVGL